MTEVPDDQKVERVLQTCFDEDLASRAAALLPTLHHETVKPARLIRFIEDDKSFFGVKRTDAGSISELSSLLWQKNTSFILDFGRHMVGYLSFQINAEGLNIDAPCRLRLTFGESPIDVTESMQDVQTWISTSWLPDETINVDVFPETVAISRRHACRYIRFEVLDTSPKFRVKFDEVAFRTSSSVSSDRTLARLGVADSMLRKIDYVSIFTLRDCMHTVFEDGPRRDRRLWIGDLRLQALTNYCTFKDYNLVKRCLFMFAALKREDHSLPACLFETPCLRTATDYIVDYDVLFAATTYDYVEASGDVETGRRLWQTVRDCVKRALAHLNPDTNVFEAARGEGWKFLDWEESLERSAGLHGVLLYSLKRINQLAEALSIAPPYEDTVIKMSAAATHFLSADKTCIVSGPNHQVSLASAAWLTIAHAFTPTESRKYLLNVLSDPLVVQPKTPYLWHHVCEALVEVGLYEESIKLMKQYWGGMIEAGADTFWECFDPSDPRSSPYGDVRNNSFCHAWSCTPSYFLRGKLAEYIEADMSGTVTISELDHEWIAQNVSRM